MSVFPSKLSAPYLAAFLNSKVNTFLINLTSPGLHYSVGYVANQPVPSEDQESSVLAQKCIDITKANWDEQETSWEFMALELLKCPSPKIKTDWEKYAAKSQVLIDELRTLETNNNSHFIAAYGLQAELTAEVQDAEITLSRADREKDCQRLISYAIGCMMGRYRLDQPGLIYAHAGNERFWQIYDGVKSDQCSVFSDQKDKEGVEVESDQRSVIRDQKDKCAEKLTTDHWSLITDNQPLTTNPFPADADGIVPITDEPWFDDDAAQRIREFLRAVWGSETLNENMAWLAESLGKKASETPDETIRRYLADKFFKDHLQTYKKRPIYWLFSSGKQGAFQALVYLHRYNEGTLARMRNAYVIPLTGKIAGRIDLLEQEVANASSTSARTKAQKALDAMRRKQAELVAYDEQLRHYADMRIQLDLDDGVKVNYGKFGNLLADVKAISGAPATTDRRNP